MTEVTAKTTAPVSTLSSQKVCKAINRKNFTTAKSFLESVLEQKKSINDRYYTKTTKEVLQLLLSVENNAKLKNIDPTQFEVFISASKGPTLMRGRRKRQFGYRLKMTHLKIILKEKKEVSK